MTYQIPENLKKKCHAVIHTASVAAGAAALAPIPGSDAPAIVAAQVTMIIGLGLVFDIHITKSHALAMAKTAFATQAGKLLAGQAAKFIPFVGSGVNAVIASGFTEELGWETADDFYQEYRIKVETTQVA